MTKIKHVAEKVRCTRDGSEWGEYVTAGRVYDTERRVDGKGDVHFVGSHGGTFMRQYQFDRAIKAGWIVRESV